MKVIDQINGSALFAQSAYSAAVATNDDLGRKISTTYLTAVDLSNYYTKDETSGADQLADAFANIPGGEGDAEVNALVRSNSGTWNDVSTTVQTNSAQWAEGGTGGDAEVNSFVYNNSATINEVNTTYQANSGSYQPLGNYIPYTAADTEFQAFQTNSGLYFKTTGYGILSNLINDYIINLGHVGGGGGFNNGSILTTGFLRFYTNSDSAYVDREKIHTWDSATYYIQNISATNDEVNTSYQTNSGTFLTAVDLTPYATTAEVDTLSSMLSGAIDYVSANVGGGVTGEFVPLSSFNELKQSYDTLSSLFATYSGQWLLPNEGV